MPSRGWVKIDIVDLSRGRIESKAITYRYDIIFLNLIMIYIIHVIDALLYYKKTEIKMFLYENVALR